MKVWLTNKGILGIADRSDSQPTGLGRDMYELVVRHAQGNVETFVRQVLDEASILIAEDLNTFKAVGREVVGPGSKHEEVLWAYVFDGKNRTLSILRSSGIGTVVVGDVQDVLPPSNHDWEQVTSIGFDAPEPLWRDLDGATPMGLVGEQDEPEAVAERFGSDTISCVECGSDDLVVCPECEGVVTEFCPTCLTPDDLDYLAELHCFQCFKQVCPNCGPGYGDWERSLSTDERRWARYALLNTEIDVESGGSLANFNFAQPICPDCRSSLVRFDKAAGFASLCERCGGIIPPNDEYEIGNPIYGDRRFHVTKGDCWPGDYWKNRQLTAVIHESVRQELAGDPELNEDAVLRRHIRRALEKRPRWTIGRLLRWMKSGNR